MAIQIKTDMRQLRNAMLGMKVGLQDRKALHEELGARAAAYVRQTIRMQGRGTRWEPIAPSTRFFKGTNQTRALMKLIPYIRHGSNRDGATVYFKRISPQWNLDQHHTGYVSPPVDKKFMKPKNSKFGFTKKKASVVPARPVWPTQAQLNGICRPIISAWTERTVQRNWK